MQVKKRKGEKAMKTSLITETERTYQISTVDKEKKIHLLHVEIKFKGYDQEPYISNTETFTLYLCELEALAGILKKIMVRQ
jgi:hypothetical protein